MSFADFLGISLNKNINENMSELEDLAQELDMDFETGSNFLDVGSKENVNELKQLADENGVDTYTSNRMPNRLYIGKASKVKKNAYDSSGSFAVNVIKLIDGDESLKDAFDEIVEEKGGEVQDEYTADYLDDLFSRVELKKYYKSLPQLAIGRDPKSKISSTSEENENFQEFLTLYKKEDGSSYDHPFDYVAEQFKKGTPICPIVRVFVRKKYLTPREVISTFKALGKNYEDAVAQLEACGLNESKVVSEQNDRSMLKRAGENMAERFFYKIEKDISTNFSELVTNESDIVTLMDAFANKTVELYIDGNEDEERNSELRYQGLK